MPLSSPTVPETDLLTRLKEAHTQKRASDTAFRLALVAAGVSHGQSEIARALGWTRQRVRQQLLRWQEQTEEVNA